jgi:hypothetical protein
MPLQGLTSRQRTWLGAAVYTAKVVGLFFAMGPIVGLLVFAIGMAVLAGVSAPGGFWMGPFFLIYGIVFAHFMGGAWACIAGVVAAAWARITGGSGLYVGPASGAVSFAIAFLTGDASLPVVSGSQIETGADPAGIGFWTVMLATHVLSATACWSVARHFR